MKYAAEEMERKVEMVGAVVVYYAAGENMCIIYQERKGNNRAHSEQRTTSAVRRERCSTGAQPHCGRLMVLVVGLGSLRISLDTEEENTTSSQEKTRRLSSCWLHSWLRGFSEAGGR